MNPSKKMVFPLESEQRDSNEELTHVSGVINESDSRFASSLPSAADLDTSVTLCNDHFISVPRFDTTAMVPPLYTSVVQKPSISAWFHLKLMALFQGIYFRVVLISFILCHDWQVIPCPVDLCGLYFQCYC